MGKLIPLLYITASILFAGCTGTGSLAESGNSSRPEGSVYDDSDYYRSLADFLHRVPGVNVRGSGNNVSVTVRGINSFNAGITPLYVIDGNAIGHSYSQANNMLNPRDINYVKVLKDSEASLYGVRGGNGVILITTRK